MNRSALRFFLFGQVDFGFGAVEQTFDVFAVGEQQQHRDDATENDQGRGAFAEQPDDENREGNSGTHRAERHIMCRGQNDDKHQQTQQHGGRIDAQGGSGQGGYAFPAFETGENRQDVTDDGGGYQCDYPIRIDGGNLLHQVGYQERADGMADFSDQSAQLGQRASEGCVRVDWRTDDEYTVNAYWLWTHLPWRTKVLVLP